MSNFINKTNDKLKKETISCRDLIVLVNCKEPREVRRFLNNKTNQKHLNNVLRKFDDDDLFTFLASYPFWYFYGCHIDEDIRLKYFNICESKKFVNYEVCKMAFEFKTDVEALRFCVECKYRKVVKFMNVKNIESMSEDEFAEAAKYIIKIPGNHRLKSAMILRDDLTFEQSVIALKSYAHTGISVRLKRPYVIGVKELENMPIGTRIRLIKKACGYYPVSLDRNSKIEDFDKILFPLMIKDNRKYEDLIRRIRKEING